MGTVSSEDVIRYETEMSNTAHQREVEDLKKAGLNPVLSLNYGGASTPSVSASSGSSGGSGRSSSATTSATQVADEVNDNQEESTTFEQEVVDAIPETGTTKVFGIPMPWKIIKLVAQGAVDTKNDVVDTVNTVFGDASRHSRPTSYANLTQAIQEAANDNRSYSERLNDSLSNSALSYSRSFVDQANALKEANPGMSWQEAFDTVKYGKNLSHVLYKKNWH